MKFKEFYNKVNNTKAAKEIDRIAEDPESFSEKQMEDAINNFVVTASAIFEAEHEKKI